MTMDTRPKLRPVEAFPAEIEGRQVIALRDPQGYAEGMVFVPQEALVILGMFDGEHTVLDIQEAFMRQFGEMLYSEQVMQLVRQLDEYHLLDSPAFDEYKRSVEEAFRRSPVRPASHAGAAYEDDPEVLRKQLGDLFQQIKQEKSSFAYRNGELMGLMAPHIDLMRGGLSYARAYQALEQSEPADLYVILGVAHAGSENLFMLTQKDFETPLGRVQTDREFVQRLQEQMTVDLFADEISHKSEHSIEFQVIFLQYLLAQRHPFQIVPILVGSFHDLLNQGTPPEEVPVVQRFFHALKTTLDETRKQKKVCMIAGVDLSHVGRRFGDEMDLTTDFLQNVRQQDKVFLDYVAHGDTSGLFQMIHQEKDWRKVCGFPAIYTFLKMIPGSEGVLLDYQQWADPPSECSVSFASLAFH